MDARYHVRGLHAKHDGYRGRHGSGNKRQDHGGQHDGHHSHHHHHHHNGDGRDGLPEPGEHHRHHHQSSEEGPNRHDSSKSSPSKKWGPAKKWGPSKKGGRESNVSKSEDDSPSHSWSGSLSSSDSSPSSLTRSSDSFSSMSGDNQDFEPVTAEELGSEDILEFYVEDEASMYDKEGDFDDNTHQEIVDEALEKILPLVERREENDE